MRGIALLSIALGILGASTTFGVPAMPGERVLHQPDGTPVKLRLWGDEWLHGYETPDGYTVVKNSNGFFVYAVRDSSGKLVPSGIRAEQPVPAGIQKSLRPQSPPVISRVSAFKSASTQRVVPSTGTGKLPVVLINFTDTNTTKTSAEFNTLFFGTNPGDYSMRQYYQEVSNGNFDVQGVILGWYNATNTHDYYGQNDASGRDMYPGSLAYEAAQAADPNVDFSQYDLDGDCKVDVLAVVHQGTGEENGTYGQATDIWSHRWNLRSAYFYGRSTYAGSNGDGTYVTNDTCQSDPTRKVVVDDYIMMSELYNPNTGQISTVGLMAHEYAHALGLPDLYDTDYSSNGIGRWGLMAGGSWNRVNVPGDRPAHMSAWSKAKLGWVNVQQITSNVTNFTIQPVETSGKVYRILNGTPGQSGEYFLLENRQKIGFDAALPSTGLLIWHIEESQTTNRNECAVDHGNSSCATTHYKVALEQADGNFDLENKNNSGDAGDPFPGSTNNTTFNDTSTPSSKLYGGSSSGVAVTNIQTSGNNVVADISVPGGSTNNPPVISNFTANPSSGSAPLTTTFNWNISDPENDPLTCTIDANNDGKIDQTINLCTSASSYTHTYTAAGTYTAKLTVDDGLNFVSRTVQVTVTLPNRPPAINSFTANPNSGNAPLTTTFNWNISDPDNDPLTCKVDVDNDGTVEKTITNCTNNSSYQYTYQQAGTYTAKLIVDDGRGGVVNSTVQITVTQPATNNPPVINSFTANPSSGSAPLTTTFSWNISDPDNDPLTCSIDADNDGTPEKTINNCTSNSSYQHTYQNAGTYTAKLTVSDGNGGSVSKTLTVTVNSTGTNNPPVISSFTANPSQGNAPLTTVLSWDISDPDNDPLTCQIDVDSNGTIDDTINNCTSNSTYQITYIQPGTYTARFTVTDGNGGSTSSTVTIIVQGGGTVGGGGCSNLSPTPAFLWGLILLVGVIRRILKS